VDEVGDEGLAMTDTQTTASLASRRPGTLRRPRYGVDAAPLLAVLASAAGACLVCAARWRNGRIATATAGVVLLASTGSFLHTTLRGKLRIWERELDRAGFAGDEHLLDMGCGRGAVLIEAAKRLPAGRVVASTCGRETRAATLRKPPSPTPSQQVWLSGSRCTPAI
jgi:hypothetical protein